MPEDIERNAEYQRRMSKGQDWRNRNAVEETAKAIHEHNQKTGKDTTYEQAHRQAVESAHRVERKKGE
jgi:hypothetical protein